MQNNNQGDIFVDLTRNRSNDRRQQLIANYAEEDFVGYRWYDTKKVAVAYPFGFGLSYAKFQYSDLQVKTVGKNLEVSFLLTNRSTIDAEEVVQVYVSRPQSTISHTVKELKGFHRVALKGDECQRIIIPIRCSDLCHWDEATQDWKLETGKMTILVGGSSDNLPLKKTVKLN